MFVFSRRQQIHLFRQPNKNDMKIPTLRRGRYEKELKTGARGNIVIEVESEEAKAYAEENNILFLETSAKTNHMVNEMFKTIAVKLPKAAPGGAGAGGQRGNNGNIVINPEDAEQKEKKGGCCS